MQISKGFMLFGLLFLILQLHAQVLEEVSNQLRMRVELAKEMGYLRAQGEGVCCRNAISQFYFTRAFEPAWDDFLAGQLIRAIRDSYKEGLNPMDYHLDILEVLQTEKQKREEQRADFELLLTDSFLLLASHLMSGKVNPQSIDPVWKTIRREGDPVMALDDALKRRDVQGTLSALRPKYKAYARLMEKLEAYRELEERGGWDTIPAGETLKLTMEDDRVISVRRRLKNTGDLLPYTVEDERVYDENVQAAIKKFQRRHGLETDGNLGKNTVQALNVPVEEKIRDIIINLERCRWLPQDLGAQYIMVNLPAFEMEMVKGDSVVMEMDVAVGKPYRQSPVFSAKMVYAVFNPYWTVPPTILAQDILPAQVKNPSYLANQNIKVIDLQGTVIAPEMIDWATVKASNFPYILRQEPGPNNALGNVKFIFPNPYNVYMHDTNHRELFVKADRALSSGCIRLARPMDLAHYLLVEGGALTEARMKEILRTEKNYTVMLPAPVQVHLQYWTSFIDERGALNFRRDIYNRNERVYEALKAPAPEI